MKILIITDVGYPQVNGVIRTLQSTSDVLREWGHTVDFISPEQFKTYPIPFYPEIEIAKPPYHMSSKLLDKNYNAFHISTEGPLGLSAKRILLKNKIPYTTAYHTHFPKYIKDYFHCPESIAYRYLKWFHNKSKAVMVPSPSMMSILESKGFKNVVHWGRGVDQKLLPTTKR